MHGAIAEAGIQPEYVRRRYRFSGMTSARPVGADRVREQINLDYSRDAHERKSVKEVSTLFHSSNEW